MEKLKRKKRNRINIEYHTSYHVAIRQNCGDESLCRETDNSKKDNYCFIIIEWLIINVV